MRQNPQGECMDLVLIAVVTSGLLLFSLFSGRFQGTIVTPPLVFIGFGFLVGGGGFAIAEVDPGHSTIHMIIGWGRLGLGHVF